MRRIALFVAAAMLAGASAEAAAIYAGFPPPDSSPAAPPSVFISSNGQNIGLGRIQTYDFNGADTAAWSDLYFGYSSVIGPLVNGSGQPMTFNGILSPVELIWTAASPWTHFTGTTTQVVTIRFRNYFESLLGANITNEVVLGASVPLTPGPSGETAPYVLAFDDTDLSAWGGGFRSYQFVEGWTGSSWVPVNNSSAFPQPCTNCNVTSSTGAFWYEQDEVVTAVPEPASMMLVGTGLLGLVKTARNRRRHGKAARP